MFKKNCVFCGAPLNNPLDDNNAEPVVYGVHGVEARCCKQCNDTLVTPFRMVGIIVKDKILAQAFKASFRYEHIKDSNILKLTILEDSKWRAAKLLTNVPIHGSDYYEIEDWLKDCLAGKEPALPDFQSIFAKAYVCEYAKAFLEQVALEYNDSDYEASVEDVDCIFNEVYADNQAVYNLFDLSTDAIYDCCKDFYEENYLRKEEK